MSAPNKGIVAELLDKAKSAPGPNRPRYYTACHDCGWGQVFYSEVVAMQSKEVHEEVLQPGHTALHGPISELEEME